ncbi:MAG TPA: TonB-dependent receptor [Steroidobacteraceae bacterium]
MKSFLHFHKLIQWLVIVTCSTGPACWAGPAASETALDEVVVTATLRPSPALEVPASVSILDAATLKDAGQEHFEDVLALVPNLNWAGDTSRPRYFQLRGIGELEQYQGAPNPSVGFLIDDIDFSGLGSAATLFDVEQIEVLRGPQATRYGANALAGLIYVTSAAPEEQFDSHLELGAGDYNSKDVGGVITGPVGALDSAFRLAVQHYSTDGYYRNAYLNRDDTDRRGELTLRARWRYQPSADLRVDLSVLHVQIDNGYDAFSIDNSRTTQSDEPSVDAQHSTGASLRANYSGLGAATLTVIGTAAQTYVKYGYDGDWGNPILWAPYIYNYTELQNRNRSTQSLEVRLGTSHEHGVEWLFGLYALRLKESLTDTSAGIYQTDPTDPATASITDTVVASHYHSQNAAIFAELDGELARQLRWSLGVRGEQRTASYHDLTTNPGVPDASNNFHPSNDLWGGHASLTYLWTASQSLYLLAARGYKAGGFNLSQGLLPNQIQFGPESDLNFEAGYKGQLFEGRLRLNSDVFYTIRKSLQLKTSEQLDLANPDDFTLFTGNADSGRNYGLETELAWRASARLTWGASVALLQTQYHGFMQNGVLLPDRELANAPHWQAALNLTYRDARGAFARADLSGMGSYYFDLPPNETTSHAYGLVNAKLGWEALHWSAYLWGRNLLNKTYAVRGFYFGDVPPNFPNELYVQLGDPLTWGVNFTYSLR